MPNVTILHWNMEVYGPSKFNSANHPNFINYIATLVHNVNAEIFCMVEVKNSTSLLAPPLIATAVNNIQNILPAANPWRWISINSGYNNEAYIIMYRVDRNFLPANSVGGVTNSGLNVVPENGLWARDTAGLTIGFPNRWTGSGGRRPYYATFITTGGAPKTFSVISYHAMFGAQTARGIQRIPQLSCITEFSVPPYDDIDASFISGDFNVDYNLNNNDYTNVLALPTVQATNDDTSLKNNPGNSDDPSTFMANAYDNIFQTVAAVAPTGTTINLMIESAHVQAPQPPPPAAQPNVGYLSAAAGAFNMAALNMYLAHIGNPIVALPPNDMNTSWDFVREAIGNHYPVVVTANIV